MDLPEGTEAYLVFFGYTHCPDVCPTALFDISAVVPGQNPGDYTLDHTGIVYLMDKHGKFVTAFNLQRPPQQAARELETYL